MKTIENVAKKAGILVRLSKFPLRHKSLNVKISNIMEDYGWSDENETTAS